MNLINSITHRYSRQGLWSLFLVCAFPLHFWTLLMVFRDVSWVAERTNMWDAIGVGAYGMLFAFMESLVLFALFALLGFLTPRQWAGERRVAFLSLLVIITAVWAMIGQLFFIWNISLPAPMLRLIAQSAHPLRILYAMSLAIVLPAVLLPVYWFLRSSKSVKFIQEFAERLSVLTLFYLFFDFAGLVIVILRNLA